MPVRRPDGRMRRRIFRKTGESVFFRACGARCGLRLRAARARRQVLDRRTGFCGLRQALDRQTGFRGLRRGLSVRCGEGSVRCIGRLAGRRVLRGAARKGRGAGRVGRAVPAEAPGCCRPACRAAGPAAEFRRPHTASAPRFPAAAAVLRVGARHGATSSVLAD